MRTTILVFAVLAFLVPGPPGSAAGSTLAKSTFDSDAEDWQQALVGGGPVPAAWVNSDGKRCVTGDSNGSAAYEFFFSAPAAFLGNKIAAYKGTLSFEFRIIRTTPFAAAGSIYMHGNGAVLRHDLGTIVSDGTWRTFTVPLSKNGWVQTSDSHQVTGAEMKGVLRNLAAINIDAFNPASSPRRVTSNFFLDTVKVKQP